jgi:diguanylate cyclase (GGDEF)-like protein
VKDFNRPYDEEDRLKALTRLNLVSDDSAERFDRITRIAQRLFAVDYADFSLFDANDQVLISNYGYPIERVNRDISLSNYALCKGDVFVIQDTLADDRFSGNLLVASPPKIRFYAGLPIRNKNGFRIGVLSVAGREPRSCSARDQSVLRDLGEMISNELSFMEVAQFDRSTQLSINDGFYSLAEQSLRVCARQKRPAAVIVFDVKKAGPANDPSVDSEFDRERHIRVFANKLRHIFRKSDVVGRLGSEEFTALLLDTSIEHVNEIVMKLQAAIDAYNSAATTRIRLSFTHGTAEFDPEHPVTSNVLVAMANRSMLRLAHVG